MRWTLVALTAYAGLATAHGDREGHGLPNIIGGRSELPRRRPFVAMTEDGEPSVAARGSFRRRHAAVESRQNANGQCGPGIGSCAAGVCCSPSGWCGNGPAYCNAPDCQINYGPGCDGNAKPAGRDTTSVARPKVGSIPYGGLGIYNCVKNGDIALTYDDGPFDYTADLLDIFKARGNVATFFMTGNNIGKGQISDPTKPWANIIKRMMAEGHQVASHTWSHENASTLTLAQQKAQIINNEIALNTILGFIPTYMRPPYSICPKQCQDVLSDLGYHITYFNLDTQGYLKNSPDLIQGSKDIWDAAVNPAVVASTSFLQIEHDIDYQTVYNLTDYMLASLNAKGFKSVTVGECLGDAPENWYRAVDKAVPTYPPPGANSLANATIKTNPSTTASGGASTTSSGSKPSSTLKVSVDASCGNGVTCQGSTFGNCCSQFGWCGNTDGHCGTGCQTAFGTCAGSGSSSGGGGSSGSGTTSSSSSSSTGSSGLKISTDASCGKGITCQGSAFGNCCSQFGWCGNTDGHCGTGCQTSFGTCTSGSNTSKSPSKPSSTSKSSKSSKSSTSTKQSSTTKPTTSVKR